MTMDQTRYDRGMTMRRKVLGDAYVDRAVANTDDFDRDFQAMLTEYAWGAVWGDERLAARDRSILNLGMIACLGRMHEFEAHFRGAMRNGLSKDELSAILRHIAVYCGFPAAVDCHRVAKKFSRKTPPVKENPEVHQALPCQAEGTIASGGHSLPRGRGHGMITWHYGNMNGSRVRLTDRPTHPSRNRQGWFRRTSRRKAMN